MREIFRNIRLTVGDTDFDFRLKKLDAFSGAALLRLLVKTPAAEETSPESAITALFAALSPSDLKSAMTSCLNHVEVLLPAGYQPVMQGPEWAWPDLEHDTVSCLRLVLEEAVWTLSGFFGESGPTSRPADPVT